MTDLLWTPDDRDPTPQELAQVAGERIALDLYAEDCRRNRELDRVAEEKARKEDNANG